MVSRVALIEICAVSLVMAALSFSVEHADAQIKAFPQAEGFGAAAVGGRGGDVYYVTKLTDDGSVGTLRHGIETAPTTGRTIVFGVGGWIDINSKLGIVKEKRNITIAGQTAPGGGIGIRGDQFSVGADHVIIRHVRFRPGKGAGRVDSVNTNADAQYVIYDHISTAFSYDENFSIQANDLTLQYSTVSYGLEDHSAGSLIEQAYRLSMHHNLYAHNHTRNPKARVNETLDWINNVVYDYDIGFIAGDSDTTDYFWTTNFDGNYYITGPNDVGNNIITDGHAQNFGLYFGTNSYDGDGDSIHDGEELTRSSRTLGNHISGTYTYSDTRYPTPEIWKSATPQAAHERVLSEFGATPWQRDEVDQLLHDNVVNRTGGRIERESDLAGIGDGGFGVLASGVAPLDRDRDGMADAWEIKHGLSTMLPSNNGDFDNDGYTNLEEYLNDLAAFKAVGPIEFQDAGRALYSNWNNWTNRWEPSRVDDVHINSGTAQVSYVGQKAGTLSLAAEPGTSGRLLVSAGWLEITDQLVVGAAGAGTVNHLGGTVRVLNDGVTIENGSYDLAGGLLMTPRLSKSEEGVFNFTGGTLSAELVEFDVDIDGGVISPGASPGSTRFTGNTTINDGMLLMELAGADPGQYDMVMVDGMLHAGGVLHVDLLGGYMPQPGHSFGLLRFGDISGRFALQLPTLDDGLYWDESQLYSQGILAVAQVPEPAAWMMLIVAASATCVWRRRR